MTWEFFFIALTSFASTWMLVPQLIPALKKAGLTGRDMNKATRPVVPEMGGLAIVAGFVLGVLLFIGLSTFGRLAVGFQLPMLLAALCTVLLMALVGLIDDLFSIPQGVKALLPLFAALPLMAMKAGTSLMLLPLVGAVDFGILYPLLLVPIAITGASNAMNMLAGFNGLEAGLGAVMCATIAYLALHLNQVETGVLAFAMLGALLAFLRYNWCPARILIGDVGTLSIGAVVATSVIIGNIESVGAILIMPFFAELYLKARSMFQADSWCDVRGDGKLVCPRRKEVYGMGRLVMYWAGGIRECDLVLTLIAIEAVFGLAAVGYIIS